MIGEWRSATARRGPAAPAHAAPKQQPWVIPFDYAARFQLTGRPGNVVQGVINIGPDGVFVATAIGYGFEEDRARPIPLQDLGGDRFVPGDVKLGQIPADALLQGCRVSPRHEGSVFSAAQGMPVGGAGAFTNHPLALQLGGEILEKVIAAREVSFLFSIVDSASGRELQDEPLHNLASLGISNGERPFRPLARPLSFLPRSTVRLHVEERSEGRTGTLFIVLYGYRAITGTHCPEPLMRSLYHSEVPPGPLAAIPSERIIPFDYVAIVRLTGRPGNVVEAEVPVNAEGGFMSTALGYGLEALGNGVEPRWEQAGQLTVRKGSSPPVQVSQLAAEDFSTWNDQTTIDLATLPLRVFPPETLRDGFRVRPEFVRLAFQSGGITPATVPLAAVSSLFETLNRPDSVMFRYEIFDSGTGRDLQNLALGNIAGLGIANGERPFKHFARPLLMLPRSTIRVRVEERFGRGNLYFVFQGYKLIGLSPRGIL